MVGRIEDYALIGDTHTAALVGQRRLDRLAVPAALRLRRRASPPCSATPTTTGAGSSPRPAASSASSAVPRRHARARDDVPHRRRRRARHRLHADPPPGRSRSCASSRACRVASRCTWTCASASTTARRAVGRRSVDGRLRATAGPDALVAHDAGRARRRRATAPSPTSWSQPGDRVPFVLAWHPSHEPPPRPATRSASLQRHERRGGDGGRRSARTQGRGASSSCAR